MENVNNKDYVKVVGDSELTDVINKLNYIIKKHEIASASDLKKYIYTHNIKEEMIIKFKNVFNSYDEMNVLNCIIFYNEGMIDNKKNLIMKIKGEI